MTMVKYRERLLEPLFFFGGFMRGRPILKILIVILVIIGLGALIRSGYRLSVDEDKTVAAPKHSILQMELEGVILNGKRFLKNLREYREDKNIKAILIVIDSPGGAVGPSQEIYSEIRRVRNELKKPVICYSSGIVASGAYYSAAACDQLIVAPGSLIGSIGVIMRFTNMEKLYDWAKVQMFSLTSGKYKDSGAEYRAMREDEKALFQEMINEVYEQFKLDILDARSKLKEEVVKEYADGRVFTGSKSVSLGFADKTGTYEDAVKATAEAAGLGDDYEVFEIPRRHRSIFDIGETDREDPINSLSEFAGFMTGKAQPDQIIKSILNARFINQPMLLMPGFWQ